MLSISSTLEAKLFWKGKCKPKSISAIILKWIHGMHSDSPGVKKGEFKFQGGFWHPSTPPCNGSSLFLINRTISSFIKIHHHLYRKHLATAYYGHTDEHTLTVEKLANMSKWWCFALRYVKLNTEKILSKFCLAFFVRSRGKLRHIMYERCFFFHGKNEKLYLKNKIKV